MWKALAAKVNLGLPVLVAVGLVISAVGMSGCSRLLDRRTRAAQARVTDLKALGGAPAALKAAEVEGVRADDLQRLDILQRLEWTSFDWRARLAVSFAEPSSDLGLVVADNQTVTELSRGTVVEGERYDLFWPRWPVYGRVLRELRAQGARGVAFDVLFTDRRSSENRLQLGEFAAAAYGTNIIHSDGWFTRELAAEGAPAYLALEPEGLPLPDFMGAAADVGDATSPRDADSVARRIRLLTWFRFVDPAVRSFADRKGWAVEVMQDGTTHFRGTSGQETNFVLRPGPDGQIALPLSAQVVRKVKPSFERPVWHLGAVLAAQGLGLDLGTAERVPGGMRITGTNGVERLIPIDASGFLVVDWKMSIHQTNLFFRQNMIGVLFSHQNREYGDSPDEPLWTNRLVVVGSTASGSNLSDRGATPLDKSDFLVTTYLNVADMILRERYVRRVGGVWELLMVGLGGLGAAWMTWKLRGLVLPLAILLVAGSWVGIGAWLYVKQCIWLPLAHPLFAGLLLPYLGMVTTRAFVEQREQQRVRGVFAKMVSPDIVDEVLRVRNLQLVGARRRVTVFFADVRGFTEMTDRTQAAAEQHVKEMGLGEAAAEQYYEQQASEVLATVNLYLATIADIVKFHRGTLDKYIGDCVMAFWGAPTANPRHAVIAVIAALDAQWAIQYLNDWRAVETRRREIQNVDRVARGEAPLPPLPCLNLGSGLNTGHVTVGMMGSEDHIVNYTVFGRDVNLASRLEGASGHARILIGEETYEDIRRDAPELAKLCKALDPIAVKGFRRAVQVYEVPWQTSRDAASRYARLLSAPRPEPDAPLTPGSGG